MKVSVEDNSDDGVVRTLQCSSFAHN